MSTVADVQYGPQVLELSVIRKSEKALRTVATNSASYLELVESVKQDGIMNPIVVTPIEERD